MALFEDSKYSHFIFPPQKKVAPTTREKKKLDLPFQHTLKIANMVTNEDVFFFSFGFTLRHRSKTIFHNFICQRARTHTVADYLKWHNKSLAAQLSQVNFLFSDNFAIIFVIL